MQDRAVAPVGGGLMHRLPNRGSPTRAKGPPLGPGRVPNRGKRMPHVGTARRAGGTLLPRLVTPTGVKGSLPRQSFGCFSAAAEFLPCFFFAVFCLFFFVLFCLVVFFEFVNDVLISFILTVTLHALISHQKIITSISPYIYIEITCEIDHLNITII